MNVGYETLDNYSSIENNYRFILGICPDEESKKTLERRRDEALARQDTELNELVTVLWATPTVNIGPQLVTRIADVCADVAEKHGLTQDEMNEVLNKVLGSFEAKVACE